MEAEKESSIVEIEMELFTGFNVSTRDPDLDSYDKSRETNTTPNSNSFTFLPRNPPIAPPTPPISNYENGIILDDPLGNGGIPWIFRDFQVEGTTCLFLKDIYPNVSRPSELGVTSIDTQKDAKNISETETETAIVEVPFKEKSSRLRKKTQTKNK
ncbi:hypothetical protein OnM2_039001 [Erysiphe neolycopersici]|uniref:Uncharacterized protein n=1 Tax=Erysiphe neolycopersici TaxID=212602 RepID=A0A420HW42_9PEZI|nr:hypothetical protein OnM2_039001 [Erysiphe neolycopersici]